MDFFKTYTSKTAQDMSFEQVYDLIRNDEELKKNTMLHRELLAEGHEQVADSVKEKTPQVAVSFRMEGGKAKANCRECLNQVLIDFDAKKPGERLPQEELERVVTIMRTRQHTLLGYQSISGLGYHAVVPFVLPEGIVIDLAADHRRGEEIFKRVHHYINKVYSLWCGHPMDSQCDNINRLTGLSFDAQAVYRPDAYPFMLTRSDLGIDAEGNLQKMNTPKHAVDSTGKHVSVPLGDSLQRAVAMVEESGICFEQGNRHNFIMRVGFILNRLGVDEEAAAAALDEAYGGQMEGRPSAVLRSCYRTASDEFGAWMPKRTTTDVKVEKIADFLKEKTLRYDVVSQKLQQRTPDDQWQETRERYENDLYLECCRQTKADLSLKLFLTVLNSSVVPEVHPLREYLAALPRWEDGSRDYIAEAAATVHMDSPEKDELWVSCFRKWFVAMVAGWMSDEVVNHQVIVFVGKQGIFKSTWLNRLMPPELRAYGSADFNVEHIDKDEKLRAAEYGLINIDELDKLSDRELNKVKTAITNTHVDERAAFGRHKEKRVRVASYVASGNKPEFLTDQTGNRRWLPFHVISIDSPFEHPLPYAGMYSQALYLLESGFHYWFNLEDINQLKSHVEEFMVTTNEEELIRLYFSPIEPTEPRAAFWTVAEIAAKITREGNLRKVMDNRQLGALMKKLGFKSGQVGHEKRRGYFVLEHTTNDLDQMHDPKAW